MTRNQLPEGVGKKIVEALKRQAEADISPMEESNATVGNSLPLTEIEDLPELQYEQLNEIQESNEDLIIEEDNAIMNEGLFKPKEEMMAQTFVETPVIKEQPKVEPVQPTYFSNVTLNQEKLQKAIMQSTNSKLTIPANVATLKNLINNLPVGVTKQTGAQIIKQTLEAMGIPMNSVLKEAQVFQEELNSSTRECMVKIQEYKTQIMQLEASVQDYQQNITQVNDIVSLFLLADK
ncbi:hypothetical protein IJD15_07480 [bacterium]|nr:hypothetical protein [bacterium]MBQ4633892.1 hypothetical protein [Bacilli bacterium]